MRGRMWGAGGGVSTSSGNLNLWLPSSIKAISSRGGRAPQRRRGGLRCFILQYIYSPPFSPFLPPSQGLGAEQGDRSGACPRSPQPPAGGPKPGSRRRGHRSSGGGPWLGRRAPRPAERRGHRRRSRLSCRRFGEETERPPWSGAGGSPGCS